MAKTLERSPADKIRAAIVLSIHPMHAERIFSKTKLFELRRRLPDKKFDVVYLYQTGSGGIVGCFDVAGIVKAHPKKLWEIVGTAGTSADRFQRYFEHTERGFGIQIRNPIRFVEPVPADTLRRISPRFRPPLGWLWLEPENRLFATLSAARRRALKSNLTRRVAFLRKVDATDRQVYREVVTDEIGRHYDDIDSSFADFNLFVHDEGEDPFGFFTLKKDVLAITDERGNRIGFTTLTWKRGGSVKTGPTILLPPYRRLGYGAASRRAIEIWALRGGARKLYCTAPEVSPDVIAYLLASGMRIEAHLVRHYARTHNELVFGKILRSSEVLRGRRAASLSNSRGRLVRPETMDRGALAKDIRDMFSAIWTPVGANFAKRLLLTAFWSVSQPKPRAIVCAASKSRCIAAVILIHKRGGATKALLLTVTTDGRTLRSLVRRAESLACSARRRKVYFLHPSDDRPTLSLLRSMGYIPEGLLVEPYSVGRDVIILSKNFEESFTNAAGHY